MEQRYTISAFTANSPGVLQRITTLFTRRKLNIESLTVSETERHQVSRFTIVIKTDGEVADKVTRQIRRMIEVQDVMLYTDAELMFKEVAFVKLYPGGRAESRVLDQTLLDHKATLGFENDEGVLIEKTGTEEEITALVSALAPLGIKEFVRSGRIAVVKKQPARESEQLAHQLSAAELTAEECI